MTDMDLLTMKLREEVAFWKGRAIEGAATACERCKDYHYEAKTEPECDGCRMKRIMGEASK